MISWPNYRQVLRKIYDTFREAIRVVASDDFIDPTGRIRTSQPYAIFANKNLHGRNDSIMKEETSGVGASITYLPNESSVNLTVGTASGEYVIRQSRHLPYVPGKGVRAQLTGLYGTSKTNNVQRIGLFDELDGPHFKVDGNGIAVVRRTSTSGTVSDADTTYQALWNLDTLDGTSSDNNPSGIRLDLTKVELFFIDYLWQGVGDIRFGLQIESKLIYVHEIHIANHLTVPSFMRPSLPLRYEIRNTGVTASATTLKEICCQMDSEGGFQPIGIEWSAGNKITTVAVTTTNIPILAIRLKNEFPTGKLNRVAARFIRGMAFATGNSVWVELHHIHDPTFTVVGAWTSVATESAVEYHTNITSITSTMDHIIDQGPVPVGVGTSSAAAASGDAIFNEHGIITQNIPCTQSQAIVLYARSFSGNAAVSMSMLWVEFD